MAAVRSVLSGNLTKQTFNTMVTAKKIILQKHFQGMPKESDFKTIEEQLPPLKDGEFLAEAVFLSVDPYMRAYVHNMKEGDVMVGSQVAKVLESKNNKYPIGEHVVGKFDWRSHTISSGVAGEIPGAGNAPAPYIIPNLGDLPLSYCLGVLGMPGTSAYWGFLDICNPKSGEVVVVSGAAGAVGMIVGQIAKIKGCKVIGITGADDKGRHLVEVLGFDGYVNYKTDDIDKKLDELASEGVDCYFDNVAGEISTTVMAHMRDHGRVSVCGSISSYNADVNNLPKVGVVQQYMARNQLFMKGFQNYLYSDRADVAFRQNLAWIQEGKMKYLETVTDGFNNMVKAFVEMLSGKNLGKAIVKA